MPGPASPNDGPTFEPPTLPPGWIAQWDGSSRKYYYVQLSTGVSQWETPTHAAPGGTPAQGTEHPYGVPGQQEVITHPDGTQTVKHPDGRLEPVLPPEGSRALEGPPGERGFGSFAANSLMNQLSGSHNKPHSGSSGHGSGGFGGLAGQLLGGLGGSHTGNHGSSPNSHGGHSSGGGVPGKLVGQLASNLFSSGNKPQNPQNYHGGQSHQTPHSGGLAGSVMGGVANFMGGNHGSQAGQNYGYSNSGQTGGYSGQAPPTSYQTPNASTPAYTSPPPNQHPSQHSSPSYNPSASQHAAPTYSAPPTQHGTPSFPPPPGQEGGHAAAYNSPAQSHQLHQNPQYGSGPPAVSQPGYGHNAAPAQAHAFPQQAQYGTSQGSQPHYGSHQQYPPPPPSSYNQQYPPPPTSGSHAYPGQPSYANAGAPIPTGTHPHHGQQSGHQGAYPGNW